MSGRGDESGVARVDLWLRDLEEDVFPFLGSPRGCGSRREDVSRLVR